jgi:hypothetical protein
MAKQALQDMELLFNFCDMLGVTDRVSFDLRFCFRCFNHLFTKNFCFVLICPVYDFFHFPLFFLSSFFCSVAWRAGWTITPG